MTTEQLPLNLVRKDKAGRVRAVRVPEWQPDEAGIQAAVAKYLDWQLKPGWIWTHIPNGGKRDKATAAKLKWLGTKAGWPDILIWAPGGMAYGLELKRHDGDLSKPQEQFANACAFHGRPYAVAYSVDEALAQLREWKAIR